MSVHAQKSRQQAFILSSILSLLFIGFVVLYTVAIGWIASLIHPKLGIAVFTALLSLIVTLYFYKLFKLRQGGIFVAQSLGAKRLSSTIDKQSFIQPLNTTHTDDAHLQTYGREIFNETELSKSLIVLSEQEQLLLNVVAELSIAAGITPPHVYVLDIRSGINAFVVGFSAKDIVLIVTRGLLSQLNRHEMEGVIAHELSHIRYVDYRLNLRLLAMVSSLGCIGDWGKYLFKNSIQSNAYDARWGDWLEFISPYQHHRKDYDLTTLLGIVLYIIGGLGSGLCLVLQSLVSKQREYLADAAGTYFLRSDGVVSALMKVNEHALKGSFAHPEAMRFSHFCFIQAQLGQHWLSTHPDVIKRIIKLKPTLERQLLLQKSLQQEETKPTIKAPYRPQTVDPPSKNAGDAIPYEKVSITKTDSSPDVSHGSVMTTPELLFGQIEAMFALHLDEKQNSSHVHQMAFSTMQNLPANQRLDVFIEAIHQLQALQNANLPKLKQRTMQIIQSNGHVSVLEAVLFAWLQKHLFVEAPAPELTQEALLQQITLWFNLIINEQQLPPTKAATRLAHYTKRLNLLLSNKQDISKAEVKIQPLSVYSLMENLIKTPVSTRRQFLFMTEQLMFEDTIFKPDEQDTLTILSVYLGLT